MTASIPSVADRIRSGSSMSNAVSVTAAPQANRRVEPSLRTAATTS